MSTDTAQMKGATACNDRAPENRTPSGAYNGTDRSSSDDATDDGAAAAETPSSSQSTTDKANGLNGAHVADGRAVCRA